MITLKFESELQASAEQVWAWMTSIEGIRTEMMPFLLMTSPRGIQSLTDLPFQSGKPLFRSYLLAGGFLPIDFSDLTLIEVEKNVRFLERSPMGTMKFWQHERVITPYGSHVILVDRLQFQPRIFKTVVAWVTKKFFQNRHRQLRKQFNK